MDLHPLPPATDLGWLAAVVDASADPLVLVDETGKLRYANPASERALLWAVEEWIGRDAFELVHPDDLCLARDKLVSMKSVEGRVGHPVDLRFRAGDGTYRSMEVVGTNLADHPVLSGILLNLRDVTRRRDAETARQAAESLLHFAFERNPIGLALCDLSGRFVRVNQAMGDMVGRSPESLVGDTYQQRTNSTELAAEAEAMGRLLAGEIDSFTVDKRLERPDGDITWADLTVSLVDAPALDEQLVFGQLRDITEQKALQDELAARSLEDPLTGLANRSLFQNRVEHAVEGHRRSGDGFAVLFIDLDDFKAVNDELGHAAGDEVLCTIGERLRTRFRAVDTVARLGGDEFAILIENVRSGGDAQDRCEEVLALVHEPIKLEGRELVLHASVGVAIVAIGEQDDRDGSQLLADADLAMYSAKLAGKRSWRSFEPSMRTVAADRLEIRQALRSGVTEGTVELYWQPIVEMATGVAVGLEALVRWRHPRRGLLTPAQFLAIAEETGASIELGQRVLESIAEHRQTWMATDDPLADIPVAVNVSARELLEPGLVDRFAELMEVGRFLPDHLVVEVAEPAIEADVERAVATVEHLHDVGVGLALDSFGAGRASVNHLNALRADYVKLEARLAAELVQEGGDDRLLRAIVALCAELDVVSIAVGIEDPHQAERVREVGVRLGQGYLFSRPVPSDGLARTIADLRTEVA